MPGIVRKLLIFAAVDGLVLQPLAQRSQRPAAALKIDYHSHTVAPLLKNVQTDAQKDNGIEVFGVIGLLKVAGSAFLVSISKRQQVAKISGKPIYAVTGVALIPIGSKASAQAAIDAAKADATDLLEGEDAEDIPNAELLAEADNDTLTTGDDESLESGLSNEAARPSLADTGRTTSGERRKPSIAEEVISKKGVYGRFAERWFSKRGWATGQMRNLGLSGEHDDTFSDQLLLDAKGQVIDESIWDAAKGRVLTDQAAYQQWPQTPLTEKTLEEASLNAQGSTLTASLLPKLLRTTSLLFASKTFFFSYDYDITRSLATQRQTPSDLPLHKDVDPEYFWNSHLSGPFLEKGFSEYVLPIMQGFIGQREFALESKNIVVENSSILPEPTEPPEKTVEAALHDVESSDVESLHGSIDENQVQRFLLTLISRRSVNRSGLRYLRRGVDEDGHTANAVETEQMLSFPTWDSESKLHSFVQTRGSIPLFFSQIPYTFKPPPTLHGTSEANLSALRKHFSDLAERYGHVYAVSLVDKHGPEVEIGEAYEDQVKALNATGGVNNSSVDFEWFEFHNVCRGMKFENVSILVGSLVNFLSTSSWTVLQSSKALSTQSGIIRTNCMDCLDRTNVVQSALGQRILELQLASFGYSVNLTSDPSTTWFNTLWADNGDAISRAYTGTSALKGDYTRTRKRNVVGALTDLSLTLSRYYHNLFDDFFAQAAIDYLLGVVTADVFAEFEARMTTADPAIDLRKARQTAITTASNMIVEESEDLLHGWALRSPAIPNTLRTFPFAEVLLLLSNKALYHVRFDWDASKVLSFERIDLASVQSLQRGAYITETMTPAQTDPKHNVGFVIRYQPLVAGESEDVEESNNNASSDSNAAVETKPKHRPSIIRVNTRTLENVRDAWSITGSDGRHEDEVTETAGSPPNPMDTRILAFKALPQRSAVVKQMDNGTTAATSERDAVRAICAEIADAVDAERGLGRRRVSPSDGYSSSSATPAESRPANVPISDNATSDTPTEVKKTLTSPLIIEEKDVISIKEAKASTGYLERVGWGIKKALWG